MVKKKFYSLTNLFLLLGATLTMYLLGIGWGLSSPERNELYFENEIRIKETINRLKDYPVEYAWKGWGAHLVKHPEEAERKLPRNLYNPIRSYHPDEYVVIKILATMNPEEFDFNPRAFSIGGAYIYLVGFLIFILAKFGLIELTTDIGFYFFHPEEMAKFYIVGRTIAALYGVGIVWLVYLIAKKIWQSERAGLLAGILTALSPLILLNSRFMYVDIPGVFWITAALYLTVSIFTQTGNINKRSYFFLGLFTGLATGNKITFIVSFLIPILAAFLEELRNHRLSLYSLSPACAVRGTAEGSREGKWRKMKKDNFFVKTIISFAGFLLAFFITNPYFFLTFPKPLVELSQHTPLSFNGWFYLRSLQFGLGWPLLAFTVSGIILSFKEKKESMFILMVWIIFFFLFISLFAKAFARYILPIIPPLIVLGSGFWLLQAQTRFINILKKVVTLFVLITTFFYGMAYLSLFIRENVRTIAGRQIKKNIPAGASIGVTEVPWQFQMPPLDEGRYQLKVTGYDINALVEKNPDYFLLSSFQADLPPVPHQMPPKRRLFWKEFEALNKYQPYISFHKPLSFLWITYQQDGASEDLIYLNPTIVIFRRKGAYGRANYGGTFYYSPGL